MAEELIRLRRKSGESALSLHFFQYIQIFFDVLAAFSEVSRGAERVVAAFKNAECAVAGQNRFHLPARDKAFRIK